MAGMIIAVNRFQFMSCLAGIQYGYPNCAYHACTDVST